MTSISALDADAYCAWRSRRDGLTSSAGGAGKAEPYRLPTDQEWEKAARGVDGRWFPWGKRFDASLCNMRASSQKGPNTVSIHAYPTDVSVYGVRGLGGNVRDWTATDVPDGSGDGSRQVRAARGGSFYTPPVVVRSAYCAKYPHQTVVGDVGFRLARTAPHG